MKTRIIYLSFLVIAASLILSSYVNGPATHGWDCSGAESGFSNPTGCSTGSGCHSSAATAGITVAIELDSAGVAVTNYVAGKSYTVKFTGTNTTSSSLPAFGFQIAATTDTVEVATPTNAGTWGTTLPTSTHLEVPRANDYVLNIVEHTTPIAPTTGTGTTGSTYVESIPWTAPVTGTGTIAFYGALNAVNNNGNADAGDLWNTTHLAIHEEDSVATATGITAIVEASDIRLSPNPVNDILNLQWENAQTGSYTATVYNINGQIITAEKLDINSGVNVQSLNTATWVPGIYLISLQADDNSRQVFRVVKQ